MMLGGTCNVESRQDKGCKRQGCFKAFAGPRCFNKVYVFVSTIIIFDNNIFDIIFDNNIFPTYRSDGKFLITT